MAKTKIVRDEAQKMTESGDTEVEQACVARNNER